MNANDFSPEFLSLQRAQREGPRPVPDLQPSSALRHSKLLLKDEVYEIVGCALEVLRGLGHGLHEKPYENALVIEFGLRSIPFLQQPHYPIVYKGNAIGEYVPDLIAYNAIVVDAKVIEVITDHERGQMLNYLRITGHKVGLLLNFKKAKLEWERMVLDEGR